MCIPHRKYAPVTPQGVNMSAKYFDIRLVFIYPVFTKANKKNSQHIKGVQKALRVKSDTVCDPSYDLTLKLRRSLGSSME